MNPAFRTPTGSDRAVEIAERLFDRPVDSLGERSRFGSSGSAVHFVQVAGARYAVKISADPRVPLELEVERRAVVEPAFGWRLPAVVASGRTPEAQWLVTAAPAITSVADLLRGPVTKSRDALDVWERFCAALIGIWGGNRSARWESGACTRPHAARLYRAERQAEVLQRDDEIGKDVRALLDVAWSTWSSVPAPRFGVLCQGDPQPANVLVDANSEWHLIDWEWAGVMHDWRMMLAHLLVWPLATASPSPDIEVEGALSFPVRTAFASLSSPGTAHEDRLALQSYLSLLLFREYGDGVGHRSMLTAARLLVDAGDVRPEHLVDILLESAETR